MAGGVEYQVTKVDPTNPETKGMVYQVHKVTEEVAATLGGKVYRARIIKDPSDPTVAGKVYQIVLIGDPDDPTVKGKVYNAILIGDSVVGPAVSPLSLPDAIANSLSYVKAFGGTEQNGTPTPDTPVDIVSNNGVIKAKHQSGLPLEYELLEYIRFESGPMFNFGIDGFDDATSEIHFRWKTDDSEATANYTTGIRVWESNNYRSWRLLTYMKETDRYYIFANTGSGSIANITHGQFHDIVIKSGSYTIDGTTTNVTINSPVTPSNWVLETSSTGLKNYFSYVKIKRQGQWIANFVTVRRLSDNRLGFYDLINSNFISDASVTATAGPEVSDPVEIYTDGTVETIAIKYVTEDIASANIDASGKIVSSSPLFFTHIAPVEPDKTYIVDSVATYAFYTSLPTIGSVSYNNSRITTSNTTITVPNNNSIKYLAFRNNNATASVYEENNTATAEMLLKIGNYTDQQEIIDGVVTRNVGIKVLDGTEYWNSTPYGNTYSANILSNKPSGNIRGACSHYPWVSRYIDLETSNYGYLTPSTANLAIKNKDCANVTAFKTWLANQYNAGTPVIVLYPLATPTTESVAGQTLQVTDGDNTLEITQASLNGLELEAEYQAAVSLTIQEVQDANLDPNVQVTIN